MLELYTHPMSPCAQKVRLVLSEKDLSWSARNIDLAGKENLQAWYLKLNKLGVVPTLVDAGHAVIESSIICEYLEDRFPQKALRPSAALAQARMRLWMKHVDNKLHPACGALQWPLIMRPRLLAMDAQERTRLLEQVVERDRRERQKRLVELGLDAPDVALAVATYRQTIDELETTLVTQAWAVGEDLSLADCALAPYFQTLHQFGWQQLFAHAPRVSDWYTRLRARPSYATAVAADFPDEVQADLQRRGADAWPKIAQHLPA